MEEKIAAKIKRVIQIGLSTHSHDHEINPVTFSTAKIKTKATIGSILDRWDFFSVRITEPPWIPICWAKYIIPPAERTSLYVRTFLFSAYVRTGHVRTYTAIGPKRTIWGKDRIKLSDFEPDSKAKGRTPPPWRYPAFTRSCSLFRVVPSQNFL